MFELGGFVFGGLPAAAAAGVGLAGAAVLTGLYLLKLQRRRVLVAFSPLWMALGGERRSERWARRLRRWLSLLLQLAFLALLVLAAADPRPAGAERGGRNLVLLIDCSASMAARDEPGGRIAQARRAADEIVRGMGPRDRAMIVPFAAGVSPETGFEDDIARLRAAIAGVTVSQEPGDLPGALAFARAVLRDRAGPTLLLISDGGFSETARRQVCWRDAEAGDGDGNGDGAGTGAVSLAGIDARFVPVGRRRDNLAILSFGVRRKPADPTSVEAALVVQSFRAARSQVTVEIAAGPDRVPIERVRLTLDPGQRLRHVITDVPAGDTRLEATLLPGAAGDVLDDLAIDDRAFAVVPAVTRLKVLRIGDGDLFVDGALLSLGAAVDAHRVPARAAAEDPASWQGYDVVIFDGVTPPAPPAAGHYLFIDPSGPGSPFPVRGVMSDPIISASKAQHPLLRHLSLGDVNIARARRLTAAADDTVVAWALDAPLIIARSRPGLRVVALAFSVRQSDLPMRTAFPLLLSQSLWFLGGKVDSSAGVLRTGQPARLPIAERSGALTLTDPAGHTRHLRAADEVISWPVSQVGFYQLQAAADRDGARGGGGGRVLAANLDDVTESDTTPAQVLALGGRPLPAPDPPRPGQRRPYWAWALTAAVALTLFEWWSYHRRLTV